MGIEHIGIFALCCRCGQMFKISENGAGLDRTYCGLCDKCKAEIGDVSQKLESLIRKIRELKNSSDQFRKDYNKAVNEMNTARDDIFGADGSAVDYLRAFINLASSGSGKIIQQIVNYTNDGIDILNATGGDFTGLATNVQEKIKIKLGLDADKIVFKRASKKAMGYYKRTGDSKGATERFLRDARAGRATVKAVGFIGNSFEYGEKANNLSKDISDFFDAQRGANDLQKLLDQIDQEIENTTKEIQCLRAELNNHECSEIIRGASR